MKIKVKVVADYKTEGPTSEEIEEWEKEREAAEQLAYKKMSFLDHIFGEKPFIPVAPLPESRKIPIYKEGVMIKIITTTTSYVHIHGYATRLALPQQITMGVCIVDGKIIERPINEIEIIENE